jgi:hypothetical protein
MKQVLDEGCWQVHRKNLDVDEMFVSDKSSDVIIFIIDQGNFRNIQKE